MRTCPACGLEVSLDTPFLCARCLGRAPAPGPWDHGAHAFVVGLDEVGWGALAGPLMVGVAAVPRGWRWPGLRDSKDLSALARERIVRELSTRGASGIFIHVETMLVREFERFGNAEHALLETHRRAAEKMVSTLRAVSDIPPLVIVDGNRPVPGQRCQAMKNADDVVPAVMTAAIFAKVRRDRYMRGLHQAFPAYRFNENAGYGQEQAELVKKLGGSIVHRRNYNPLKSMLASTAATPRMQQLPLFKEP
jgi:ribonuclease HII